MSRTATSQQTIDIFFDYYFLIKPVVKLLIRVLCQKESPGMARAQDSGSPRQGCLIHKPKGQGLLGFKPSIFALHHQ
ncbi:MAG: hypothetical protein EBZ69_01695 [Alphaproteobacteria bacterium]|nr:hypothetical protein [Alphaproteobacteria bacterium]